MTKVRMLFAPDGAGLGERIAMKLAEQDFSLAFGAYDEGDLDPAPAVATIMVWSADVHQSGRLLSAANDARKAKRLIPVAIGNPEILPAFQALTPVDLLGWDGKDADPRWQFILDEIALAEKAQALTPPTEDIRRPAIKMGLPDEYKLAGGFAGILFLTAVAGIAVGRQVSAPTLEAPAIAGLGEGQAVIASADASSQAPATIVVEEAPASQVLAENRHTEENAHPSQDGMQLNPSGSRLPVLASLKSTAAGLQSGSVSTPGVNFQSSPAPNTIMGPPDDMPMARSALDMDAVDTGTDDATNAAEIPRQALREIEAGQAPAIVQPEVVQLSSEGPGAVPADQQAPDQDASEVPDPSMAAEEIVDAFMAEVLEAASNDRGPTEEMALASLPSVAMAEGDTDQGEVTPSGSGLTPRLNPLRASDTMGDDAFASVASSEAANSSESTSSEANSTGEGGDPIAQLAWASTQELPLVETRVASGNYFKECLDCPDMAVIPAGIATIGSPPDEFRRRDVEGPRRQVKFAYDFALSTREVTFDEWQACVNDGGCDRVTPPDAGWGRGSRPVINVSFEDAERYVRWLTKKTGTQYRIPSEAEWEYAARGGNPGPFAFGGFLTTRYANYHGEYPYRGPEGDFRGRTMPTGSFAPNAFGLYDVHGNVWEWTADCWRDSHVSLPETGAAIGGGCGERVVKGGAWNTGAWRLRLAHRQPATESQRRYDIGFRVARSFP
ncbi:MAG: formylglycine-generating enzyme family protein [Pseudomonadota bacterium]